jgi:hypothetical protein
MKNQIIEKIEQDKSKDIPIILNSLKPQKTKLLYYCEYSTEHNGDIIIEDFYKFFCLNDVFNENR